MKLQFNNPSFHQKLAQAHAQQFDIRGRIEDLKLAEKHFSLSIQYSAEPSSGQFRNLAHNLITQHRFCEALSALEKAADLGGEKDLTLMKLYDVYLELGEDARAYAILLKLKKGDPIQYKIRLAKWEDKQGRLDNAITCLESAIDDARSNNNTAMLKWLYSNIGDFYGHAGQLEDSRNAYVQALKLNNADWYSLKGLSWIAYSGENNIELTKSMLRLLDDHCDSPSIDMLQIDVLQSQSEMSISRSVSITTFERISSEAYGCMYDSYKVDHYIRLKNYSEALSIAAEELEARATPQTYAQYAKALYMDGQKDLALDYYIKEVKGATYEPLVLLDMLMITRDYAPYHEEIKMELKGTRYELGPFKYRIVEKYIDNDSQYSLK